MRPKNFSGDGTRLDAGIEETHGERNRLSVVAAEIASLAPGSGVSTAGAGCCAATVCKKRSANARKNLMRVSALHFEKRSSGRVKFTISCETQQLAAGLCLRIAFSETLGNPPLTRIALETKQEGALT